MIISKTTAHMRQLEQHITRATWAIQPAQTAPQTAPVRCLASRSSDGTYVPSGIQIKKNHAVIVCVRHHHLPAPRHHHGLGNVESPFRRPAAAPSPQVLAVACATHLDAVVATIDDQQLRLVGAQRNIHQADPAGEARRAKCVAARRQQAG